MRITVFSDDCQSRVQGSTITCFLYRLFRGGGSWCSELQKKNASSLGLEHSTKQEQPGLVWGGKVSGLRTLADGGTDVQLKTRSWLSFKESEVFVLLDGNWQGVLRGVRVCKRMRQ
jgi:hypothetical protein